MPLACFNKAMLFRAYLFVSFLCISWVAVGHAQDISPTEDEASITILVTYHSLTENTEKMARGVVKGARAVPGTIVTLKRVEDVTATLLFRSDAVIVGSPVYWSNMAGAVKSFFDDWQFKFGVFPEFKMKNKVGAAFTTGGQVSSGKEVTMLTILAAMLGNKMIVVSEGGAFGASATTEGMSPGIDERELADARALGKRVAEVTWVVKRGHIRFMNQDSVNDD